jgi:Domain of unknown function (DUF1905)
VKTDLNFEFTASLWKSTGQGAWVFVTVPKDASAQIKFFTSANKTAWGSVRVAVQIGQSRWNTSLFPDKKSGCYFLPIKATVRKKDKLDTGDRVKVQLEVAV